MRELNDITKVKKPKVDSFMSDKDVYDGNLRTDYLIMRNLKEEATLAQSEIEEITTDLSAALEKAEGRKCNTKTF